MTSNLLSVWSTIGSVVVAIVILLAMITIHEFGHYLAGKIFHFKINEFSIGFGPALFKHTSKKTGELFAVRVIPLGGYCAFEGEDGTEEETEEAREEPVRDGEPQETLFLTGEAAEETEKVKDGDGRESRAYAGEITAEEGFSSSEKETPQETAKGTERNLFTEKPCWQRIIVLAAGAFMNYLLALVLLIICFFAYGQTLVAVYETDESEEYAAEYSLQDRDIFLKVDGKTIYLTTDVAGAVNGKKQYDMVEFVVSRVVDTVTETDADGNETVSYMREIMTVNIMLRSDVNVSNSSELNSAWAALGIAYDEESESYLLASSLQKFGFFETIGRAFVYSFKIAGSILKVLGELLTGQLGLSAVGGPVTTITMTSQIVSRGFRYFLEIAGYIGVNLAVFNLLPVPALDGCKIIFTAIEWVRKKPISRKVEAAINAAGLIFLLGFAILVDILQFV